MIELQVEEIGSSLRYGALNPAQGSGAEDVPGAAARKEPHPADSLSISAREYADDDPWFGLHTNPSGRISLPGADPDPAH